MTIGNFPHLILIINPYLLLQHLVIEHALAHLTKFWEVIPHIETYQTSYFDHKDNLYIL